MAFGPEPRSKFDALNFAKPLRKLLGIKGNQDIPQELNTDLLQPIVDIAQGGYQKYETFLVRQVTIPTATSTVNQIDLIGPDSIASSPILDSTDFEVLILGHHCSITFAVAPPVAWEFSFKMEVRGKPDIPAGASPSTPCVITEQDRAIRGNGGDSIFLFGLFGNKSIIPTAYINPAMWNQSQFSNKFWLPNKMLINREVSIDAGGGTFLAGDLIVDELFGIVVPKHTQLPSF